MSTLNYRRNCLLRHSRFASRSTAISYLMELMYIFAKISFAFPGALIAGRNVSSVTNDECPVSPKQYAQIEYGNAVSDPHGARTENAKS
jgi:hypothetical protein